MMSFLSDIVWNILIFQLIGVGLAVTFVSRFVQIRYFVSMFKLLASGSRGNGVTPWQALTFSLAGRVGGGNIAGVAVAIMLGGPGAIFWMWVVAVVGMATSVLECSLAQLYKRKNQHDNTYYGGPAYYIRHGLGSNWQWLAVFYSILLFITFGMAFNCLQSYAISASLNESLNVNTQYTGIVLAAIIGLVIFGGLKRLVVLSEIVVPIMAVSYLALALYVVLTNIPALPSIFYQIFSQAFGIEQGVGGGVGSAIIYGARRGLFSNEAGLGSAPNVAATATAKHPMSQGLIQGLSVFTDTVILCTCTAVLILLSDVYVGASTESGITLTQQALQQHIGSLGSIFVSFTLVLFGFTTITYNYYLGENALTYLMPSKKSLVLGFRLATILFMFWGANQDLATVLSFSDLSMGILAMVNLLALGLLFKVGMRLFKDYDKQISQGVDRPALDPNQFTDLDIDQNAWENTAELRGADNKS